MTSRSRFGLPSLFAVNASRFSPGRRPLRLSGTAICVIAPHAGEEAGTGGNAIPDEGCATQTRTANVQRPAAAPSASQDAPSVQSARPRVSAVKPSNVT